MFNLKNLRTMFIKLYFEDVSNDIANVVRCSCVVEDPLTEESGKLVLLGVCLDDEHKLIDYVSGCVKSVINFVGLLIDKSELNINMVFDASLTPKFD